MGQTLRNFKGAGLLTRTLARTQFRYELESSLLPSEAVQLCGAAAKDALHKDGRHVFVRLRHVHLAECGGGWSLQRLLDLDAVLGR